MLLNVKLFSSYVDELQHNTKLWQEKTLAELKLQEIGGENFGVWQRQSPFNILAHETS